MPATIKATAPIFGSVTGSAKRYAPNSKASVASEQR
jgi:hypothetical protein